MKSKKQLEAKVVMVGDVGVGKSSITVRYVLDKFDMKMQSTLGAAYMDKVHMNSENKSIKFKIWDTAGQQKYKAIAKLYYKDCQVALLIYDVTRRQTFENLKNWVEEVSKHAPKNIIIGVIANKIDLLASPQADIDQQQITKKQEGQSYAQSIGAVFFEISARSKQGVDQLFNQIANKSISLLEKSTLSTKEQENFKSSAKLSKSSFIQQQDNLIKRRKKCCEN